MKLFNRIRTRAQKNLHCETLVCCPLLQIAIGLYFTFPYSIHQITETSCSRPGANKWYKKQIKRFLAKSNLWHFDINVSFLTDLLAVSFSSRHHPSHPQPFRQDNKSVRVNDYWLENDTIWNFLVFLVYNCGISLARLCHRPKNIWMCSITSKIQSNLYIAFFLSWPLSQWLPSISGCRWVNR